MTTDDVRAQLESTLTSIKAGITDLVARVDANENPLVYPSDLKAQLQRGAEVEAMIALLDEVRA